ncbi:MAG: FAD-dependent oxidoreductase [Candidatus Pacebacteria bacterium]|jgi:alkyl hydroperoxide reductase subunit F|nr:FAD-dependent oxidoreductase [Candidatus Paceibacterota bacterium]
MTYDLIIIGGGPAGISGTVYAARKRLKTLLITPDFGGQSIVSPDIKNWIGHTSISGAALAESLKQHAEEYKGEFLNIVEGEKVVTIEKSENDFTVKTDASTVYQAKTILIASGSGRRKLDIPGADVFEHKGLTYCASCDGPLFADKDVVVIGGGNAAFETAAQLLAYAKSVTLLNRTESFKCDEITVEKVTKHPNMRVIVNAIPTNITGTTFTEAISYTDTKTGQVHELKAEGIFVEIGQIPNTDFVSQIVKLDDFKKIIVDPLTQQTSMPGIWAAGDATNGLYHQNNIAAGDAVKALENLYLYLHA